MAITDLGTLLAEISDLFDGLVTDGDIQANLEGPPLLTDLEGRSPILSTHYGGSRYKFQGAGYTETLAEWVLTLFINRRATGSAAAEIALGDLVTKILQIVRDGQGGTNYEELASSSTPIAPSFVEIGGVPYRVCEVILESITHDS